MATMTSANATSRRGRRSERPTRGDIRERQILEVVERLLATKGYDALTMEAVAKEVGLTRSSLYFYFDSKQVVATALVSAIYQQLTAPIGHVEDADSIETMIDSALKRTASLWREHSVVMRFAAQHLYDIPEIAALWESAMEAWTNATVQIMQLHPNGLSDRRHARALNVMVERSFWYLHSKPHTDAEEDDLVDSLRDIFLAALR